MADPSDILHDETVQQRFWAKVEKRGPDDCWEWQGSRSDKGYGSFSFGGKSTAASRVALALATQHWPVAKEFALHSCDNPPCCNPKHLRWGSNQENIVDAVIRGRWVSNRGTRCLTVDEVHEIRRSDLSRVELAARFGVSKSVIRSVISGRTWALVTFPDAPIRPTGYGPHAILNWEIVREIRAIAQGRKLPAKVSAALAEKYGVHPRTIRCVVRNAAWVEKPMLAPSNNEVSGG